MTTRRHTLAGSLLLILIGAGCFGSHGAPDGGPIDPDAGTMPGDDPPDDPPPGVTPIPPSDPGTPPGSGCRESGPARRVTVDVSSEFGGRCELGAFTGALFYDLSTDPGGDGLYLQMDFCPTADADCICDVHVTGVGVDLAEDIVGATTAGALSGELSPDGLVIEIPCEPSCPDGMCACVPTLVLAAADGSLDEPPVRTEALTVSPGPEVCRITDAGECDFVMWTLNAITWSSGFPGAIGTEVVVEQGQTVRGEDAGGVSVRALRASGYECGGGDDVRDGAWVAWGHLEGT